MQGRTLEAGGAVAGEAEQRADAGLVAEDRQRLAGLPVGDGRPGVAGGSTAAIEEKLVQPRAAGEEVGAQATIDHVIASAAIHSVIAAQGIDGVGLVGAQDDFRLATAQELVLQPGHRAGVEVRQFVAVAAIAVDQHEALVGRGALQ